MELKDGMIYYINFKGNLGREINKIHLGIIYTLPGIDDVVFCVPLTSPKLKHFKSQTDFENRNYTRVKHFSWQYLKQTDSIALLDQILLNSYENQDKKPILLDEATQKLLKEKIIKYINLILYKK